MRSHLPEVNAGAPLHRLIEQRAAANPAAVAVRFRDGALTYAELNSQANRLAAFLRTQGLGAEHRVVVCVDVGFDIAVALLAILKVGAVYVPLDPSYPAARIRAILDDTQPAMVISSGNLTEILMLSGFAVFRMDSDAGRLSDFAESDVDAEFDLQQTAYIFYTSGTTGRPKGVMASHANLSFYILAAQHRYGITECDVIPAIARFSFSISMFELMSPLVAGGTLLLLERDHIVDPARMARTLQEITFFHAGPSLLRLVIAYIRHMFVEFSAFAAVRHASSGGDMVPPELLESLKEIFSGAEVFVIYGCSEISCMGCTWPVPRDSVVVKTFVGRSFEGVTVRIFDEQHGTVPVDAVGEICFAGPGVVKGYLNRDELTAEKFIEVDGERFYCTGDMGRINGAGDVQIIGRRDFQIQLRGMRIEPGEIEYALRKAPGVDNAVVKAWTDERGEQSLAAYVVFQQGHDGGVAPVHQHILDTLPDYMVPSFYIELAALPLNHNMKVDRNALPPPKPADRRAATSTSTRSPRTSTEKQLLEIWRELLGVRDVGLDDNFCSLGAHSMLVMQLIFEVERRLNVALEGTEILEESAETLATMIDNRTGNIDTPPVVDVAQARRAKAVVRAAPEVAVAASVSSAIQGSAFIQDMRRQLGRQPITWRAALQLLVFNYGVQALLGYRLGRFLLRAGKTPYWWPLLPAGWLLYALVSRYVRLAFDIRLHLSADIGSGLYIGHFGGILLRHCRLGKHCSISQSVRVEPQGSGTGPVIGDRVWLGANASIVGSYRIGSGSTVSAAAVVHMDIPENTLCMGDPARIFIRGYDNGAILAI